MPPGGVPAAGLPGLQGGLAAGHETLVRAHVERVEVVGLDEAYLDLQWPVTHPARRCAALVAEIRATTGLTCSVGIGPNKLVAKVASDAEKPAGFVVLSRRAGV